MKLRKTLAVAALMVLIAPLHRAAQGAFHLWAFSEFFSNADGSVQFLELVSSGSFETQASGAQIRTTSGGNVFTFPGNLSGDTFNKRLLIATPGFASLAGAVTPDFTLPSANFFNPVGDTIRLFSPFFGEFHSRTFTSVPTDGVASLNYPPLSGTQLTNSPANFAGQSGSVNLSVATLAGDYNEDGKVDAADYVLWRKDGINGAQGYEDWRANFGSSAPGSGAVTAVPEPATLLGALAPLILLTFHRPGVRAR